jgi:hypothetical protein
MKYSHSKAMAVFYKIVKLVKNGVAEYWKEKNIEALVTGSIVQESDDIYRLSVNLFDVYSRSRCFINRP